MFTLGLDIGSNSVGSAWLDSNSGGITTGTSIFPAGVDESDDKRGEPKNAKRRMARRTRITLARRAQRKRELRGKLIEVGLLPSGEKDFRDLLDQTDPWELRRKGLDEKLSPHMFGRVLLHLAQRRGALGLKISDPDESDDTDAADDGKVKAAIGEVRAKMLKRESRTFGEFIAMVRDERVTPITSTDRRPDNKRKGARVFRDAIRNKAASYEHCADRDMIRHEFGVLWKAQKGFGGQTAKLLTRELCTAIDYERGDSVWRHKGLLFGQRRTTWDLGTLGRCVLEPSERCAPHADMYASRYLVVETVNNLKIIERGEPARPLTSEEREKIKAYLSGSLGEITSGKRKGEAKTTVSVTDLRNLMGTSKGGWGRASKGSLFHFNIESDEDRTINTDWFSREIIRGAVTTDVWESMSVRLRGGINRAILKYDPDHDADSIKLRNGVIKWGELTADQSDALVAAWKRRPRIDSKRLKMSRRAVRNVLMLMDRDEPWPDHDHPDRPRWITQIEARKLIAEDADFRDVTTGKPIDDHTRRRYATGTRGATARDRYYMDKHVLRDAKGLPITGPNGKPLSEPPPPPLISNPVVRKAIHEVRRHLVEYMMTFGCKPDNIYIELAREARMGKKDSDRLLFRNRLRNRIRRDIIREFGLETRTSTQQREAVKRVVLAVQQGGVCPLCGNQKVTTGITERMAASGEGCEVAHVLPQASGGDNRWANIVLSHTKCNRDMGRRTPRQLWSDGKGFDQGMDWVQGIYGKVDRPKPSDMKNATGNSLWACYFTMRDDKAKIEQFKKDITDIQQMTASQEAATKYASKQVMAYLADALYDGKGLPERGGERLIFTTDGLWTSRFRREWGLFFDPHDWRAKEISDEQKQERQEKDRGDHHHHAIDAIITALCTRSIRIKWEDREKQADRDRINTADEEQMDHYRRNNPLPLPSPFKTREELREAVRRAVFGDGEEKPICHRPVKRKLIGALHEETLFGPILDNSGELTGNYTSSKSVLALDPNHLRMSRPETEKQAIERLALRRQRSKDITERDARKWARSVISSPGYKPAIVDPPPGKSGIVRDIGLRARLRTCLVDNNLDPEAFSATEIKKLTEAGGIRQASGVPIRAVVLLRAMTDPVLIPRKRWDQQHQQWVRDTGRNNEVQPDQPSRADRAYVGGNNHHIEIRVNEKGKWSGEVVTAFEVAQRKLTKLRAFREAEVPIPKAMRELPKADRRRWRPIIAAIEAANPLVDRRDDDDKGGRFVMSLCEGEMIHIKHKKTGEPDYFVVAKLDKPRSIVVVPHWDARAATERKDADGKKVPNSKREDYTLTPSDIMSLAPAGRDHAVKVLVSPLGVVRELEGD